MDPSSILGQDRLKNIWSMYVCECWVSSFNIAEILDGELSASNIFLAVH